MLAWLTLLKHASSPPTYLKKRLERKLRLFDERLRVMEKKMWTIAGALTVISFIVSPIGQKVLKGMVVNQSLTESISTPIMRSLD